MTADHPSSRIPHAMLSFDWDDVAGETVTAVLGLRDPLAPTGLPSVAVVIGNSAIVLSVNADTDEIHVAREAANPNAEGTWSPVAALSFAVGRELGWCWQGWNSQGYGDTFTMAFGGLGDALQPRCMFLAEASDLVLLQVQPFGSSVPMRPA